MRAPPQYALRRAPCRQVRPPPPRLNARQSPLENRLLAALPAADYERLLPHLELVPLPLGWADLRVRRRAGLCAISPPTASCPCSTSWRTEPRRRSRSSATKAWWASPCSWAVKPPRAARSCRARATATGSAPPSLKTEFGKGGELQHLLLRYTQALITQMAQTAVCNRHHSLEQQLCRWLLLSLDRLASNELTMTQELIANMLGVRREGVTEAAGQLQAAGVDPLQPRQDHRAGPPEARSAGLRVLRRGEARVRPPASARRRELARRSPALRSR